MKIFISLIVAVLLCSCGNSESSPTSQENPGRYPDVPGNQYARGFQITERGDGFELILIDPWNTGNVFERYMIYAEGPSPDKPPDDFKVITPPFDRWAVSSTTHIGFMKALGEAGRIVGCTSPDRVYDSLTAERYQRGELKKIGSDMEFNFETVLGIEPDLILQTAFEGQKNKDSRFLATGLDFVYILEWMEPHPLGRAEWIRVFGLLTGKLAESDSIFMEVSNHYNKLKDAVSSVQSRPLVMIGNNFNGTWYMPGGQNYMCRFLEDAGYRYPYVDSGKRGSLALSFENVLEEFRTSDIWLGVSAMGLDDLLREDTRYSLFDPFKSGQVYSVNGRLKAGLGNDYWESGVVYPDLILADLISIGHPGLVAGHSLMYYKKLGSGN